jgi:hypothetical protein
METYLEQPIDMIEDVGSFFNQIQPQAVVPQLKWNLMR